jgi:prepilin-type N-terminal cleavage/methylation domain-containing protein
VINSFKSAITLVELLIVIAIFGILAGVAGPNLSGWNCRQELLNDFNKFNQYLNEVRIEGQNRNITSMVKVKQSQRGYGAAYLRPFILPNASCYWHTRAIALEKQIPILAFPQETWVRGGDICFYPDGSADGQSYQFSRDCGTKKYTYRATVFGATGLIEKTKYNASTNSWDEL